MVGLGVRFFERCKGSWLVWKGRREDGWTHGMMAWRRAHVLHSILSASISSGVAFPSSRMSDSLENE
jgi:hypothetical protein